VILDKTKTVIQRKIDETKTSITSTVSTVQATIKSLNPFTDSSDSKQSIGEPPQQQARVSKKEEPQQTAAAVVATVSTRPPPNVGSIRAAPAVIEDRSNVKSSSKVTISTATTDEIKPQVNLPRSATSQPLRTLSSKTDGPKPTTDDFNSTTAPSNGFSFSSFQLKLPSITSVAKIDEISQSTSSPSSKAVVVTKQSSRPVVVDNDRPVVASKSKSTSTIPSKATINIPVIKISDTPTANLSGMIVKKITSIRTITTTAVTDIDRAVGNYSNGKSSPDQLYRELSISLGSKDAAFQVLPDLVGSLPKGSLKSALFNYYQQNA